MTCCIHQTADSMQAKNASEPAFNANTFTPVYNCTVKILGEFTSRLLGRAIYWFEAMNRKPFFKMIEPGTHYLYKDGDSWSEDLNKSPRTIKRAIKKLKKLGILKVWRGPDGLNRYYVNLDVLSALLAEYGVTLNEILPNKSRRKIKSVPHRHECDVAPDEPVSQPESTVSRETRPETPPKLPADSGFEDFRARGGKLAPDDAAMAEGHSEQDETSQNAPEQTEQAPEQDEPTHGPVARSGKLAPDAVPENIETCINKEPAGNLPERDLMWFYFQGFCLKYPTRERKFSRKDFEAYKEKIEAGYSPEDLKAAAYEHTRKVFKTGRGKRYVVSIANFFGKGIFKEYLPKKGSHDMEEKNITTNKLNDDAHVGVSKEARNPEAEDAKEKIRAAIGNQAFRSWFERDGKVMAHVNVSGDTIYIEPVNPMVYRYIKNDFADTIHRVTGMHVVVLEKRNFDEMRKAAPKPVPAPKKTKKKRPKKNRDDFGEIVDDGAGQEIVDES